MTARLTIAMALAVAALAGIALAAPGANEPTASATALTAQVTGPGLASSSSGELAAPPAASGGGAFVYPEDGSILRVGAASASVAAQPGISSSAQAVVDALAVSVFGGELTADSVNLRAGAAAGPAGATGDVSSSAITGLVVLGTPTAATPNAQVQLGDWGTLELLATTTDTHGKPQPTAESTVVGLRIRLTADHGGLPAGAEIVVGSVTARSVAEPFVEAPPVEKPSPTAPTVPARQSGRRRSPTRRASRASRFPAPRRSWSARRPR